MRAEETCLFTHRHDRKSRERGQRSKLCFTCSLSLGWETGCICLPRRERGNAGCSGQPLMRKASCAGAGTRPDLPGVVQEGCSTAGTHGQHTLPFLPPRLPCTMPSPCCLLARVPQNRGQTADLRTEPTGKTAVGFRKGKPSAGLPAPL